MSAPPVTDTESWMRQVEKDAALAKRRGNPFPRLTEIEERGFDNRVLNGDFRINQRAYVSGTALVPGLLTGYCFDRWKTSGRANLAINPTARVASTYWSGSNSTISRITGVTIPGRPDIVTAVRGTQIAAATGGLYMPTDAGTGGAPFLVVKPGNIYRISAWLRASVAKVIQPSAQFYTGAAAFGSIHAPATVSLAANVWTLVTWTVQPAPGTNRMGPYWYSTVAWAIGNTLDVAGVTITEGTDVVEFFDGLTTGGSFIGTANASTSIDRPVQTTVTWSPTVPQGQVVTINSLGAIQQVIEQRDLRPGNYVLSHAGSGWMRAYNRTATVIPEYAPGPIAVVVDGTADLVVEFGLPSAGAFTVDRVQFIAGTKAYPFQARSRVEELLHCQRYYVRFTGAVISSRLSPYGAQASTSLAETVYIMPTTMKGAFVQNSVGRVVPEQSSAGWTDGATYTQALQADGWSGVTSDHLYNSGQVIAVLPWLNAVQGAAFRTGCISAVAAGGWVAFHGEFY